MPPREAEIYRAALAAQIRANVPPVAGDDPQVVGFFVEIIIASVVGWLIQRCLSRIWPAADLRNPGYISLWRLDRAIRRACDEAATTPEARAAGMDAATIQLAYAGRIRTACLRTGCQVDPAEIEAMRAAFRGP